MCVFGVIFKSRKDQQCRPDFATMAQCYLTLNCTVKRRHFAQNTLFQFRFYSCEEASAVYVERQHLCFLSTSPHRHRSASHKKQTNNEKFQTHRQLTFSLSNGTCSLSPLLNCSRTKCSKKKKKRKVISFQKSSFHFSFSFSFLFVFVMNPKKS